MDSIRPPERRQLTVMLCDLVGWSALALRLDAEELAEVIRGYRQRCTNIITAHGGIVAQYVGDAILAYFGYPDAHEDDAERAIWAALNIVASERSSSATADSSVHIGIATGIVVVGNLVGDATKRGADAEISAVGSALNLAARLQGLAGSGMVVVSEETHRLSRGIFRYNDLGRHNLKGFDKLVQAWQVVGESKIRSRFHALRASALTPLVNRRSELQTLRELWDSARAGAGKALLLSSEPGVGKSRLAEEIARQIAGPDSLCLWYYCTSHLQSSPLAPVIRQLTRAASFAEKDNDDAKLRKLARLVADRTADDMREAVPLLASLLSIRYEGKYPPLNMSPQREKQRLFQLLMRLLAVLAHHGPGLIVVEDLHWIDPSSDEALGLLIDQLKELPILLVLTARPEFHTHWGGAHVVQMHLSPLDRADSITMIELLCGNRPVPRSTIRQIADKTDGLPLFIEDLTRDVLELAEQHEATTGVATLGPDAQFAIPATLTDSLMSRLDRLGIAKSVAQIGATIGREFSHELLAKVADLPDDDLRAKLHRLVDSGLLISRRAGAVPTYVFKHALVRDAAYASLLKKGQATLHARIASVLLESFSETAELQPELLAYHFEAARDIDNSVRYLVKAAKLSAKRSGFVEAIAQLERALRLLETQARSRARIQQELRVYLALGGVNAEYRGFSSTECGRAYTTALELCRELGDAPEIFSVLSGVGSFEITRAGFDKCRALAEESLAKASQQQFKPPFIMGHLLLGGTLFLTGELTASRKHLEEALRVYEEHQTSQKGRQVLYVQDQKSTGLCYLALTLTMLGYLDSGLRAAEDGMSHSESLGGPHTINYSLCYLAAVHYIQRDSQKTLERATQSLASAREQGFATWIGVSQMIRGASLISSGKYEEALEEIANGISAHRGIDAIAYQPFGISLYAQGLIAAGRFDEALRSLDEALALSERTGERFYAAETLRLKGETLARKGEVAEAERWLREAIELSRRQQAKLFELRSAVTLCRALDGPRREMAVRDVLEPVHGWFVEGFDTPDMADARALLK